MLITSWPSSLSTAAFMSKHLAVSTSPADRCLTVVCCDRLDGLKEGPVEVASVASGVNWLSEARPVIEQRMARYAASETHFALLSVGPRRRSVLEEQILLAQTQLDTMMSGAEEAHVVAQLTEELQLLRLQLDEEVATEEAHRQENIRRRHNYVPFIVALLRHLAARQQLAPMVETARSRARTQAQAKK